MGKIDKPPSIEGLRHARNLMHKQWEKERQRVTNLMERNKTLVGENEMLKRKLKFLTNRCR